MPARAKPAPFTTTPRPTRVSKEKVRTTIKTVTVPKVKAPRLPGKAPAVTKRIPSPISLSVVTPIESGESSSDEEHSPDNRGNLMDGIEKMIRDTMSVVFTNRDDDEERRRFAT
jgi:hypothetical protein